MLKANLQSFGGWFSKIQFLHIIIIIIIIIIAAMTYNQVHYFRINHLAG